jgi:hypothetical protein
MIRGARLGWGETEMPLARYFLFIGGVLLALLFVSDAFLPKPPAPDSSEASLNMPVIRINSDRKWPERMVFDTSNPTAVPAASTASAPPADTAANVASPPKVAEISTKAPVRESFAQFVPPDPKKQDPKPQHKRKIAKSRPGPPTILVAQQPRFGFFDTRIW